MPNQSIANVLMQKINGKLYLEAYIERGSNHCGSDGNLIVIYWFQINV